MNALIRSVTMTLVIIAASAAHAEERVAQHLQDVSVTIKSASSEGSGVLITREIQKSSKDTEKIKVNFVITCAHVVDNLRSTRDILNSKGQKQTIVEFRDAQIVKELVENGRKVGELKMDAKVILYSDAEDGEDIAILMVRKLGFVDTSTEFELSEEPTAIGTSLFHVGSLLGQSGANSMTAGIMSQVGRVLPLGTGDGVVFDQTTVTAFPGSSGGGVFLTNGKYVGMLVRGAGETFNLIVPVRRMQKWATSRHVEWVLDPKAAAPTFAEIQKIKPESEGDESDAVKSAGSKAFPYLIRSIKSENKLRVRIQGDPSIRTTPKK
jgi:S1-C subfamily serine protease